MQGSASFPRALLLTRTYLACSHGFARDGEQGGRIANVDGAACRHQAAAVRQRSEGTADRLVGDTKQAGDVPTAHRQLQLAH